MKPPGNDRLNVLGDKTAEFYLNPRSFVENRVAKHKSKVFQQRFLNKSTIWLTDHHSVNSFLYENSKHFDQGYDVMNILPQLFGTSCVLFQNSDIVLKLRQILGHSIHSRVDKVDSILQSQVFPALEKLCGSGSVTDLYQILKEILTQLFLHFFFDIDPAQEPDLIATITELSIEHWHGIMSVPTAVKFVGNTFQKALKAKGKLTEIFHERLKRTDSTPPLVYTELLASIGEETAVDHVLVCISALLPKAMASILTSALIQVAIHNPLDRVRRRYSAAAASNSMGNLQQNKTVSPEDDDIVDYKRKFMDALIKESHRLYPPFFGGRKIATGEFNLGKYQIEQGQAIIYMSYFAHRDPEVFPYPEEFLPERWMDLSSSSVIAGNNNNHNDDDVNEKVKASKRGVPNLFTFGGGTRECVGTHFTNHVLSRILTFITDKYDIATTEPNCYYTEYKWLPVCRPVKPVKVNFTPLTTNNA